MNQFFGRIISAVLLMTVAVFSSAYADDERAFDTPYGDRFWFSLGAYSPRLDTTVQVGNNNGEVGTRIDFESNFGMSKNKTLPQLRASWQIARKHRLDFNAFSLKRDGSQTSSVNIKWGDKEFEAGDVPIQAFFDVDVFALYYSYALVADPVKEFSLSIGLSIQDISTGLRGTLEGDDQLSTEQVGVTAPLPSIGLSGGWAFTDNRKWILSYRLGAFAIALDLDQGSDEEIKGKLIDSGVYIYHKTFKHIGFGGGIDYFRIDVDYEKRDLAANLEYSFIGPTLFVTAYF